MNRNRFSLILIPLVALAAISVSLYAQQTDQTRPNILFMANDDLNSCLEGTNGERVMNEKYQARQKNR